MIQRYVAKISGPLLDRIDMHIEVPAMKYKELRAPVSSEASGARPTVDALCGRKEDFSNAQMLPKMVRKHSIISADGEKLLENAITRLGLSARARAHA
jgi:magnesium chelatase family protein